MRPPGRGSHPREMAIAVEAAGEGLNVRQAWADNAVQLVEPEIDRDEAEAAVEAHGGADKNTVNRNRVGLQH